MIKVREAVREVLRTQLDDRGEDEVADARRQLNFAYDQFVSRFGAINESANRRAFRGDPDCPLLCSLEEYDDDTKRATKAAIFIAAILCAPLVFDPFWLNRIAKYLVLRDAGHRHIAVLGLRGNPEPRAGPVLRDRRLHAGDVLKAGESDKPGAGIRHAGARFHALERRARLAHRAVLHQQGARSSGSRSSSNGSAWRWESPLPVVVAGLLGWVMFRKRISGVFVSIITLALVLLVRLVVIDAQPVTNGFNGLTDLGWFTVAGLEFDPYVVPTYYLVAVRSRLS